LGLTARAVGIENTRDAHVDAVLVVKAICQRLGDALPLIVACTWTDGVDVAPAARQLINFYGGNVENLLIFVLWVYLRVAINLCHRQAREGVSAVSH
jgi:hypothetical protein